MDLARVDGGVGFRGCHPISKSPAGSYRIAGGPAVLFEPAFGHIGEFPKVGDPSIVPLNSRILTLRTPTQGTPNFRKLPYVYNKLDHTHTRVGFTKPFVSPPTTPVRDT